VTTIISVKNFLCLPCTLFTLKKSNLHFLTQFLSLTHLKPHKFSIFSATQFTPYYSPSQALFNHTKIMLSFIFNHCKLCLHNPDLTTPSFSSQQTSMSITRVLFENQNPIMRGVRPDLTARHFAFKRWRQKTLHNQFFSIAFD
jgi:hypothetical protein